ncbi:MULTISPECIES: PE-PPE domain-containing protein [unclassified Mycobacterium]|uniref:PE-PPE domain-containing protein n=1 Tax=unclassified Mycobacterium TaxID=2642494 RepID=UPI0029C81678|nr:MULTISPECIES: PE-PPE domain-containing protein [unclassified Mycobacterium]
MAGAVGVVAAAGAAVVGLTPTIAASPQLMAEVYYLPGTKIGTVRTPAQSEDFALAISTAAGQPHTEGEYQEVPYPASIWPFSTGGLSDPKWNDSVAAGLAALTADQPGSGDTIIGYSQGAVVATEYKRAHPDSGVDYVLVENPNRPNGGLLERFNGLNVPILDISFNGATPVNPNPTDTSGKTVDISRQYDGWSDFPAYPLNVLADANAIAGIYYLHGSTQDLGSDALDGVDTTHGNTMYYQVHGDTTYYLIKTDQLPILMPFNGIVPKPVLDALDPPLRYLVELGYDRADYSTPTPAGLVPNLNPVTVATGFAEATGQGVQAGLGQSTPTIADARRAPISTPAELNTPKLKAPKLDLPKLDVPKLELPKLNPPKPRNTVSTVSNSVTKPNTKAGNGNPVKSIQSALKSIAKNLAPKAKPAKADKDSSGES